MCGARARCRAALSWRAPDRHTAGCQSLSQQGLTSARARADNGAAPRQATQDAAPLGSASFLAFECNADDDGDDDEGGKKKKRAGKAKAGADEAPSKAKRKKG